MRLYAKDIAPRVYVQRQDDIIIEGARGRRMQRTP